MECDPDTNTKNAQRAAEERKGMLFGEIDVTIVYVDDKLVTFRTRGADDNEHPFTVNLDDVWLECPSTAQKPGDRGSLKITSAGLQALSDRDRKTRIKNANTVALKWPVGAGSSGGVQSLSIWPTEIVIRGYAHGDPNYRGEVQLTDATLCGRSQTLAYDAGGMIELLLTDAGFDRFGLPLSGSIDESLWAESAAAPSPMKPPPGAASPPSGAVREHAVSVCLQLEHRIAAADKDDPRLPLLLALAARRNTDRAA